MKFFKLLLLCVAIVLASCNAQQRVLYIQGVENGTVIDLPENYLIRLRPFDKITVVVNSKNPELAKPFNSSSSYNSLTGGVSTGVNTESSLQVMTVDKDGYITLPFLGKIKAEGLTRNELETNIEKALIDGGYIYDPNVNVNFVDFTISIIGEVNAPGRYDIDKDKITIFDALALAKDMTIYGSREDVAVLRERDGKRMVIKIDLRTEEVFRSPCYYLEQNDIIIVSPNKYKAATAEINQNRSFWISLASTAISLATLMLTIFVK